MSVSRFSLLHASVVIPARRVALLLSYSPPATHLSFRSHSHRRDPCEKLAWCFAPLSSSALIARELSLTCSISRTSHEGQAVAGAVEGVPLLWCPRAASDSRILLMRARFWNCSRARPRTRYVAFVGQLHRSRDRGRLKRESAPSRIDRGQCWPCPS